MSKLLSQIGAAILGLWLASLFVQGVAIRTYPASNFFGFTLKAQWQVILLLGLVVALFNYFSRPLIKALHLPLKVITLGLLTFIATGALIWLLDTIFDELTVPLWLPITYTTLIIWALDSLVNIFSRKHK